MITETAAERAEAYRLLSLCFHPPDERLLEALRETDVRWLRPAADPVLEELQKDYAQLFVGPFRVPAPPYGSVYLESDRRVCGDSTMDVMARYREEGLELTLREPADHVAAELEYMYVLAAREMEALATGDEGEATRHVEKQRDFLHTHLGAWVPLLTERIVENARTGFYQRLAKNTDAFVRADLDACVQRTSSSPFCRSDKEPFGGHSDLQVRLQRHRGGRAGDARLSGATPAGSPPTRPWPWIPPSRTCASPTRSEPVPPSSTPGSVWSRPPADGPFPVSPPASARAPGDGGPPEIDPCTHQGIGRSRECPEADRG